MLKNLISACIIIVLSLSVGGCFESEVQQTPEDYSEMEDLAGGMVSLSSARIANMYTLAFLEPMAWSDELENIVAFELGDSRKDIALLRGLPAVSRTPIIEAIIKYLEAAQNLRQKSLIRSHTSNKIDKAWALFEEWDKKRVRVNPWDPDREFIVETFDEVSDAFDAVSKEREPSVRQEISAFEELRTSVATLEALGYHNEHFHNEKYLSYVDRLIYALR